MITSYIQGKEKLSLRKLLLCALLVCIATPYASVSKSGQSPQSTVNEHFITKNSAKIRNNENSPTYAKPKDDGEEFVLRKNGMVVRSPRPGVQNRRSTGKQIGNPVKNAITIYTRISGADLTTSSKSATRHFDHVQSPQNVVASLPSCSRGLLSPAKIKALVARAARRHGVHARLATAIAWAESRFGQKVNSPKGARGPMQLMQATARRFHVDDICDPRANIEGGVEYLSRLIDEFENPLLVAAAYNAGEDRVREYGGIPPFHETETYVARVLNRMMDRPMPAKQKRTPEQATITGDTQSKASRRQRTGVIETTETGKFVGGVMQF